MKFVKTIMQMKIFIVNIHRHMILIVHDYHKEDYLIVIGCLPPLAKMNNKQFLGNMSTLEFQGAMLLLF